MKQDTHDTPFGSGIFLRIALATAAVLLIPLVAMNFTTEVRWDTMDFIVMGALLFGLASLFVLAARRVPRKHHIILAGVFVLAFLAVWAELAVGVFTTLGS